MKNHKKLKKINLMQLNNDIFTTTIKIIFKYTHSSPDLYITVSGRGENEGSFFAFKHR